VDCQLFECRSLSRKSILSEGVKRWSIDIMTLRNMPLPFLPGITPMDRKER